MVSLKAFTVNTIKIKLEEMRSQFVESWILYRVYYMVYIHTYVASYIFYKESILNI